MRFSLLVLLAVLGLASVSDSIADEPVTLLGTIVKWQYPGSELSDSEMRDGMTINANGDRTLPSSQLKTTMSTDQPVAKVVEYYKTLLASKNKTHPLVDAIDSGVSASFSDESVDGVMALQTIFINSDSKSTVIVIARPEGGKQTRITWKQYVRHPVRR